MKKITKEEYAALPEINGWRICPGETDYSEIQEFGNSAQFGNWAQFGNSAQFGEEALFEAMDFKAKRGNPLIQFDRFGSVKRNTQFFNTEGGIWVRCGCQLLLIDDFRQRVSEKYGNTGHGLIYLGIADVAQEYFRQEDERAPMNPKKCAALGS